MNVNPDSTGGLSPLPTHGELVLYAWGTRVFVALTDHRFAEGAAALRCGRLDDGGHGRGGFMQELLDTIGGWKTVGGVVLALVILSLFSRLFRKSPIIKAHVKKAKCGKCGWFGEVPIRRPECPKCGAPL